MVGGTWRALAAYAMRSRDYPLTDPHAFALDTDDADRIARKVARLTPEELAPIPGISALRAAGLPDAAAMLRIMLDELEPDGVVFSSWGLAKGCCSSASPPTRGSRTRCSRALFSSPRRVAAPCRLRR
jgi:exopolyphosphatase/guanosine-5'-triphosphate,3'-diphosphate pyrophosphatase